SAEALVTEVRNNLGIGLSTGTQQTYQQPTRQQLGTKAQDSKKTPKVAKIPTKHANFLEYYFLLIFRFRHYKQTYIPNKSHEYWGRVVTFFLIGVLSILIFNETNAALIHIPSLYLIIGVALVAVLDFSSQFRRNNRSISVIWLGYPLLLMLIFDRMPEPFDNMLFSFYYVMPYSFIFGFCGCDSRIFHQIEK
ncbi:MAG: hypothetical protein AAF126_19905, partial [Chloroflexota bacterium]